MRERGIVAKKKRRFQNTTDSNRPHPIAPNILEELPRSCRMSRG